MKSLIVIPCRYHSTRLPAKHLIELCNGKTIFELTYAQCLKTKADRVVIATDHADIFTRAQASGANVMMTNQNHKSGTDRVAEVAAHYPDYQIVVNVQGDEPLIAPDTIDGLITAICNDSKNTPFYSAMTPFTAHAEAQNRNNVKVVVDSFGYALYFSRALIPHQPTASTNDDDSNRHFGYKHLGIYAYRRDFLLNYPNLPITPLAVQESLEQLRALEQGYKIGLICVDEHSIGVDEAADIALLNKLLQG